MRLQSYTIDPRLTLQPNNPARKPLESPLSNHGKILGRLGASKGGLARMKKIREQRRQQTTKGKSK